MRSSARHAARSWCEAANLLGGKQWDYIFLYHNEIYPTDSFEGVLAKRFARHDSLPEI